MNNLTPEQLAFRAGYEQGRFDAQVETAQQRHISYVCPQCHWSLDKQPASKPWVGLTDEERRSLREWQEIQKELGPVWAPMMLYLYEAIEAKLKEKNA